MSKQPSKELHPQNPKYTDHLANERTFLAWIRTSIALMGFGFVIVKFAVFVKQVSYLIHDKNIIPNGNSSKIGIVMILLGAVVAIYSFVNYKIIKRRIEANKFYTDDKLSLFVTIVIIISSILMTIYLIPSLK
jgi:putative membrane protein